MYRYDTSQTKFCSRQKLDNFEVKYLSIYVIYVQQKLRYCAGREALSGPFSISTFILHGIKKSNVLRRCNKNEGAKAKHVEPWRGSGV